MGPTIRQRKILEALHDDGLVEVEELARTFDVSLMTIRRDLATLESGGYLVRTHGGAVKSSAIDAMFSFERRIHRHRKEKERICREAARLVNPGDVIFIDCGTTLFRLARFLKGIEPLRIITNSLPIVSELSTDDSVLVTLTGGDLVPDRKALYGRVAEEMIGSVHADKAFIGADGVAASSGLTSYDEKEAGISSRMAESADQVFLLCDSSKIGNTSYYRFGSLDLVDVLITDASNVAARLEAGSGIGRETAVPDRLQIITPHQPVSSNVPLEADSHIPLTGAAEAAPGHTTHEASYSRRQR